MIKKISIGSDGHISLYDLSKIADLAFEIKKTTSSQILWDGEIIKENIDNFSFDFNEYLNNDEILKAAMKSLSVFGMTILNNVIYLI